MKRIVSKDLPQANNLTSVLKTVIAVGNGARTDIEIANRIPEIMGDARQGRYYRNATEMLGFIKNYQNKSIISDKGRELLKNPVISNPIFISSILNLNIYQFLIPFLDLHHDGCTMEQITSYMQTIADKNIGRTMIPRRISTIITWLRKLGFVNKKNSKLILVNNFNDDLPSFVLKDITQPLLPKTGLLTEYEDIESRFANSLSQITYLKNQKKLERSINAHNYLVNLVAKRLRNINAIPKSNELIDLAVRLDNDYIFEMKSTNEKNVRSQVRKGMSQLYEYRYLQNLHDANLVLVIEKPLGIQNSWMTDFLEGDRDIYLVWDGNGKLFSSDTTCKKLPFLYINN